jgi:hypothetical protein
MRPGPRPRFLGNLACNESRFLLWGLYAHMAMGAIERVVLRWRTNGIGPNAGATPATIARFEQQVGTKLPDDVRSFFALADGIEGGFTDEYFLSFWSIERIISETADLQRTGYQIDPRDTPIADFLINSWFVFLRRLGEGRVGVWVEGTRLEFPSLTSFFERYEEDPESLGLLKDTTFTRKGGV